MFVAIVIKNFQKQNYCVANFDYDPSLLSRKYRIVYLIVQAKQATQLNRLF